MFGLVTPRRALAEIKADPRRPWWADKIFREVERHLERTMFHGKSVIDMPMSYTACEAVLEEAIDAVQRGPASVDEIMADLRRDVMH